MLHRTNLQFNQPLVSRETTKYIILHHSEISSPNTVEDIHQQYQKKGWAGIGHHYFIAKDGEVYEGRPRDTVGAHTLGKNQMSVGICFEGDFDKEEITEKQENSAVKLLTTLSLAYSDAELRRHSDFSMKTGCPGKKFPFDRLLQRVANTITSLGVSTAITCQNDRVNPYTLYHFQELISKIRENPKTKDDLECYEAYYGPITEEMSIEDTVFYKNYLSCFDIETELKGLTLRTDPFSMDFHDRFKGKTEPTCLNTPPSPADFDLFQRLIYGTFYCDYSFDLSDHPDSFELTLMVTGSTGKHVEQKVHAFYPVFTSGMKSIMDTIVTEIMVTEAGIANAMLHCDENDLVEEAVEIQLNRDERKQMFRERARQFLQKYNENQAENDSE